MSPAARAVLIQLKHPNLLLQEHLSGQVLKSAIQITQGKADAKLV